jgi:hypothetical protein
VKLVRVVVGALAAILIGWLGLPQPSTALTSASLARSVIYSYDSNHQPHLTTATAVRRGPPAAYDRYDAGDRQSLVVSASSDAGAACRNNDYDHPAPRARAADTADGPVEASPAVLSSLAIDGVAAKSAPGVVKAGETCLNSFTGDTPVLMADGTSKPIKDVELGDRVMAEDPETGERGPRKVVDLIRHSGPHTMVAVRLADGATIDATDRHPFWVKTRGSWVDAIDLAEGDIVVTAAGRQVVVEGVGIRAADLTAYNLTVDDLHTYFARDDAVLVHNAGCMNLGEALATKHGQERLAARGFLGRHCDRKVKQSGLRAGRRSSGPCSSAWRPLQRGRGGRAGCRHRHEGLVPI